MYSDSNYYLLTVHNGTQNVQGALHKLSPILGIIVSVTWKLRFIQGHTGINKGWSCDSNPVLAYIGTQTPFSSFFKVKSGTENEQFSPTLIPTQACAHTITCTHGAFQGLSPHRVDEVQGRQTPQKCLITVSSFSDQPYKECPGTRETQEQKLVSQGGSPSVEFNATSFSSSHFTLFPPTTIWHLNYNNVFKYRPDKLHRLLIQMDE